MANNDGPPYYDSALGDVAVPAAVAPLGTPPFGSFPSMRTSCIIGAPKLVSDLASRNAIPSTLRAEGMTCYVTATTLTYQLVGGILNANWVALSSGSSASVLTALPYVGLPAVTNAVYVNGGGSYALADASLVATSQVVGLVSAVDSPAVGQATVITSGRITGFVGLTPGARYILSTTPGVLLAETDTLNPAYPSAPGEALIPVGVALTSTDLLVNVSDYMIVL